MPEKASEVAFKYKETGRFIIWHLRFIIWQLPRWQTVDYLGTVENNQ